MRQCAKKFLSLLLTAALLLSVLPVVGVFAAEPPPKTNVSHTIVLNGGSFVYNGLPKILTATTTDLSGGTFTYTYLGINGTTYPVTALPPKNPGTYTVTATYQSPAATGTKTAQLVITPPVARVDEAVPPLSFEKGLDVAVPYGTATYINKATHVGEGEGAITYSIQNTAVATINSDTGELTIVGAGQTDVTATAARVAGLWAEGSLSYSLTVSKKEPVLADFTFNLPDTIPYGQAYAIDVAPADGRVGLGEVTVNYNGEPAAPVDAGSYAVTIDVAEGANYLAAEDIPLDTFEITQKSAESVGGALSVRAGLEKTYTFDLSALLPEEVPPEQINAYTFEGAAGDAIITDMPTIEGKTLSLTIADSAAAGDQAEITIRFASDNYAVSDAVLTVTVSGQINATISGAAIESRVYNGKAITVPGLNSIRITDDLTGEPITDLTPVYTWSGNGAPKNAGNHTLTLSADGGENYVIKPQMIHFSITKAPLKLTADDQRIREGRAMPKLTFTAGGLIEPDTWADVAAEDPAVTSPDADRFDPGSYPVLIEGGALNDSAGANYKIETYVGGKLTVTEEEDDDDDKKQRRNPVSVVINANIATKELEFNQYTGGNIEVAVNRMQYIVRGLYNGEDRLTEHEDYEEDDDIYTISEDYLRTLPLGEHAIDFHMNGGENPRLTISVKNYVPKRTDADIPTAQPSWQNPFIDVNIPQWFYNDVAFVSQNNLMTGTAAGMFSPDMNLTRGMIVSVLYRHAGAPNVSALVSPFSDVPEGLWYTDAVVWAAANGIVSGTGNGRFSPDSNITREDLTVILHRYAVVRGIAVGIEKNYQPFADEAAIAGYAKKAVEAFFKAGIVSGKPNNRFDPKGSATRAEVASMLHRFFGEE